MEIHLLGAVEIVALDRRWRLGPPQEQAVLAALAADAGRPVQVQLLLDRVWGERLPVQARQALRVHVSHLRRVFEQVAGAAADGCPSAGLVRYPAGYQLHIDADQVDLHRFRRLASAARGSERATEDRACLLGEALGLWRGPALAGLGGAWAARMQDSWGQERLDAAVDWVQAGLRLGQHGQLIGPVRALLAEYPLAEPLAAALMQALVAAGRHAEALEVYARTRARLVQELGAEPGRELRALHQAILRGQAAEAASGPARPDPVRLAVGPPPAPVPAQLPADVYGFVGRSGELARLSAVLAGAPVDAPTSVVISAVSGTAGVGKTALAVHWAHQVAGRFPDGQLYVNLRGFDPGGQVMEPAAAVRGFIDALGVPADRVPAGLDAQAGLYRSLLAGKRMLVVLDNARDAGQARPLLPGTPTVLVVVTSRSQLTGLVAADGAHPLTLDLLTHGEAGELLARRLGRGRVAAEPEAVEAIITRCARLPLALSIAAARAAQTGFPLTALAAELADTRGRLGALDAGDAATRVRAVFSWSYHALTPEAARLLRLLGLHPGPDVSVAAAASLAGLPRPEAARLLGELARASLTTEHVPGRYGLHDLLAAYAADLSHDTDPDHARRAATTRLLDHYTHTAHTADRLLHPTRDPIPLPLTPPAPGTTPEQPPGDREALAWLDVEHQVLLAAVRLAATAGFDTHTWQLAWALDTFLDRRGHWQDEAGAWQAAVAAADRLTDPTAAAHAHRTLAQANTMLGRYDEAHVHLRRALDLYTRAGDRVGQARTHLDLGYLSERQDQPGRSLGHAQQALTLYQAAGHRRGQANALNGVGWCHALLGDHTQALTYCQQALTLFQQAGDHGGEAQTWDSLGYAHHHLTHHAQAADCYQHALTLFRGLGDRHNEATTLSRLGDTHHTAGDPGAARAAWTQALAILTDLDHPDTDTVRAKLAGPHQTTRGSHR